MASPRHRLEKPRRKIPVPKFSAPKIAVPRISLPKGSGVKVAAPVASLATLATVGAGVLFANPTITTATPDASIFEAINATAAAEEAQAESDDQSADQRPEQASRSATRNQDLTSAATYSRRAVNAETKAAVKGADEERWTTATLNLWLTATAEGEPVGEIAGDKKVLITGREAGERAEIVVDGQARWVTAQYLSDEKPMEGVGGICNNGTSVPAGVSPNIKKVHQAVCARFPEISTYGTFRGDGEHAQGIAVDIMVSGARGWEIAEYLRANHQALGVSYVIYAQKIWSVQRSGEGWRGMSNRGSATANHYDHVHVTTY